MAEDIFLDLDLGPQIGRLRYKSFEEFKTWLSEETTAWNWLVPVMNSDGFLSNAITQGHFGLKNQLQNLLANYHNNPSSVRVEISNALKNWLSGGRAVTAKSAAGKFVLELSKTSPISAAWALAALTTAPASMNLSGQSTQSLEGIVKAMLWRNGIKGTAATERASLEELFAQATATHAEGIARVEGLDALFKDHQDRGEKALADFDKSVIDALAESRKKFDDAVAEGQAHLDLISKTYEASLALQAPVLYWKRKAAKHFIALWFMVGAVLLAMVFGTLGLMEEVKALLPTVQPGKWPEPWKLGLLLISLTMAIWIIRILMKVMLSQLHLHTDADERAVMSNAYLALLKRGKALQDDDRELILLVLFRPSATGIVDDGGPATPIEIITRAVQGKGGA